MVKNNLKISVVIASYNAEKTIENCLKSIFNQDYRGNYEVIVVDSSKDNTPKIIKSKFPKVRLIKMKKSFAELAKNLGVKHAKSDIIAFTDSDCVVPRNWLSLMVKFQKDHDVVGGSVHLGKKFNILDFCLAYRNLMSTIAEVLPA